MTLPLSRVSILLLRPTGAVTMSSVTVTDEEIHQAQRAAVRSGLTGDHPVVRVLGPRQALDRGAAFDEEEAAVMTSRKARAVLNDWRWRRRQRAWRRAEFMAAAEAEAMRRGRPLTREELERVLRRYPGEIGETPRPRL